MDQYIERETTHLRIIESHFMRERPRRVSVSSWSVEWSSRKYLSYLVGCLLLPAVGFHNHTTVYDICWPIHSTWVYFVVGFIGLTGNYLIEITIVKQIITTVGGGQLRS